MGAGSGSDEGVGAVSQPSTVSKSMSAITAERIFPFIIISYLQCKDIILQWGDLFKQI